MILADTSVWIDHFRRGCPRLSRRLTKGNILCHPFVIGELACGRMQSRAEILRLIGELPAVRVAMHSEAMALIDRHSLAGEGLGWVDIHLLAATLLTPPTRLWTRDKSLAKAAAQLGVSAKE